MRAAFLPLLAAASALAALAGALGTRAGLWSFRTGFAFLRWGAYGGLAAGVWSFAALFLHATAGRRLAALGALLLGAATAAMPALRLREAKRLPMIHDLTTDTADPPAFVALLEARRGAANPSDYGGPQVAALQKAAYPDLATLRLKEPPAAAFDRALAAARRLGWAVAAAEPSEGRLEAVDTTFWFGFKDDVVVRVRPDGAGSKVDARSVSRVGRGDAGANARRLRAFLKELRR